MIIAFNIARMNWYRVSSALIEESLRRGWNVQCWHARYPTDVLKQNTPSRERVPAFKYGRPSVVEYEGKEGLRALLSMAGADIVVDIDLLPLALPDHCKGVKKKPLTVLLEGISNPRLQIAQTLPRYDVFTAPSEWHIEQTKRIRCSNQALFRQDLWTRVSEFGPMFCRNMEKLFWAPWSSDDVEYYLTHTVVVGTSSLDDLGLVDRNEVRKKWNISSEAKVVGYLPSPYDMPVGYFWGDLNMSGGMLQKLFCYVKHRKFGSLKKIIGTPCDIDFVRSIRKFCDRNGAYLVAKMRHSRPAKSYLADAADLITGEDGYHPHTILELFKASDIVFGYTSTGALECVAAGTPYVDIELPAFPKAFYLQNIVPSLEVTKKWNGVVWSLSADEAMDALNNATLDHFSLDTLQRDLYISNFTSQCDGLASARLLDICEHKV